MTSPFVSILYRLTGALALWGPLLLWLVALRPGGEGEQERAGASHLAAATALALIGSQAAFRLGKLPVAEDRRGRYRVIPNHPLRPGLLFCVGLGAMLWGSRLAWVEGPHLGALAAVPAGFLAIWLAVDHRNDPLWGTWLEVSGDALRVHCPRAEDWSIPLGRIVAVHRRPRDGSLLVEAPEPEHDVFVPSPSGGSRYHVSDVGGLLAALSERAPVLDTPVLLGARRRPPGVRT